MKRYWTVLGIVLGSAVAAPSAQAVDGVKLLTQPKTFPIIISAPGSYRLKKNITVPDANTTAIQVQVNDVSIDLNGFEISGPCTGGPPCSPVGAGIGISGQDNLTVRNGTIQGMGSHGIHMSTGRVEGVAAHGNGGTGIYGASTVVRCTASFNHGDGIAANGVVTTSAAAENDGNGFTGLNLGTTITNSSAIDNRGDGFRDIGTVSSCESQANRGAGIYSTNPTTTTNSLARSNSGTGINGFTVSGSSSWFNSLGINAYTVTNCALITNGTNLSAPGVPGQNVCNNTPCP